MKWSQGTRRIVFLVDYYHLDVEDRGRALDQLIQMVQQGKTSGEEIMVAALAGGLRIEQNFTGSLDRVRDALTRMKYDVTLFAPDSRALRGRQYFDDLSTLMDVLAQYDGAKGVVLVSPVLSRTSLTESATTTPPAFCDRVTLAALPAVKGYLPRLTQVPALVVWLTGLSTLPPAWVTR